MSKRKKDDVLSSIKILLDEWCKNRIELMSRVPSFEVDCNKHRKNLSDILSKKNSVEDEIELLRTSMEYQRDLKSFTDIAAEIRQRRHVLEQMLIAASQVNEKLVESENLINLYKHDDDKTAHLMWSLEHATGLTDLNLPNWLIEHKLELNS